MKGLRLVKPVAVRCAVHVRVQVFLCLPVSSITKLTVTFVTTGVRIGSCVHQKLGRVLEGGFVISSSPVRTVVHFRA